MEEIKPLAELGGGYVIDPDFSDDFDGNALDGEKWLPFYPGWHGRKEGRFCAENVLVRDGRLVLLARYEDETPAWFRESGYSNLTAACVRSRKKVLYGCFQMRFRANNSAMSNAFWLNGSLDEEKQFRPGSYSDEIDIFEVFAKSPKGVANRFFNTCHRISTPYAEGRIMSGNTTFSSPAPVEDFSFADGFHTATFLWEKSRLRWYLDARLVFDHPNDYYHNAMYVNIDTEPLFSWSGEAAREDLPAEFLVDYVRVWRAP